MKTTFFIVITTLFSLYFDATAQIEITTAEELAAINKDTSSLNDSYILMNNITVDNWTPIGNFKNSFLGTFEGNGFTITINNIDTLSLNNNYLIGLFGSIGKQGCIKNLRVGGTISYSCKDKDIYAGGIAGWNIGCIRNCVSTANITASGGRAGGATFSSVVNGLYLIAEGSFAGGITGGNIGLIENCYTIGNILAIGDAGYKFAGGIAGANGGEKGKIKNSYATGNIMATGNEGSRQAGGLIGHNNGDVSNCVALNGKVIVEGKSKNVGMSLTSVIMSNFAGPAVATADKGGSCKNVFRKMDMEVTKTKMRMMETGKKVEFEETQVQSWWVGQPKKFNFLFGTDDDNPWAWDEGSKRPVLYWEKLNL